MNEFFRSARAAKRGAAQMRNSSQAAARSVSIVREFLARSLVAARRLELRTYGL
jgi:hypothetical protein